MYTCSKEWPFRTAKILVVGVARPTGSGGKELIRNVSLKSDDDREPVQNELGIK